MLNVINNPVGIDVSIRQMQEYIHRMLLDKWGADIMEKYQSYPRCYRNIKGETYIAEVFVKNKEYKEVYWNDTLNAISFFGIGETFDHRKPDQVSCHLIYFVNLAKIKPEILHRADEETRLDIVKIIADGWFGFKFESCVLLLPNVLKEYAGTFNNLLGTVDIHPLHCFRLNFTVTYDINNCFKN